MKGTTIAFLVLLLGGCASSDLKPPTQTVVLQKEIYQMSRSQTIDAIRECETSGTRAVPIYGNRLVNGYMTSIILEINCAPSWK